ncbi:hypothetical protein [Tenacibaculum maritimum]|nr:hypothetical protein [Tenacibaculum maritimum]MCD9636692.1 hypothetical protein [Tenacibaculum maritimum]
MAYNKINYYKSVIKVQNKVLELKSQDEDLTFKEIYWEYIYEKVDDICYRTYHTYLGVPAKRELKKLLEAENLRIEEQSKQLNLF